MALIKDINVVDEKPTRAETEVSMECLFNNEIMVMRTRGSNDRSFPGKVSQTIHINKARAQELYDVLDDFINNTSGHTIKGMEK